MVVTETVFLLLIVTNVSSVMKILQVFRMNHWRLFSKATSTDGNGGDDGGSGCSDDEDGVAVADFGDVYSVLDTLQQIVTDVAAVF